MVASEPAESRPVKTLFQSWLVAASKAVLCFLIFCSFILFGFITFARPTDWYANDPEFTWMRNNLTIYLEEPPVATEIQLRNGVNTTVNIGRDAALVSGGALFPLILQWGPTLAAAVFAAVFLRLHLVHQHKQQPTKKSSPLSWVTSKVNRVLHYPLPPRKFWDWWCGGLSVIDALLAAMWLGLAVIYLYHSINRSFTRISAGITPPPPRMLSPPSPAIVTNATGNILRNMTANLPANATTTRNTTANITAGPVPSPAALRSPPPPAFNPSPTDINNLFLVRRLDSVGKLFGEVLRTMIMLLYYPVSRSGFLQWVFGTEFSTIIKYHRWMSYGMTLLAFIHSSLYMIQWGAAGDIEIKLEWTEYKQSYAAGVIAMVAALLMCITSSTWFRRTCYWLFYYVHVSCALVFTLFLLFHYKALVNWILPGIVLYLLDRAFRYWQAATNYTYLPRQDIKISGNIITLTLRWLPGTRVAVGQTMYLRFPAVSVLESHPVSVADVYTAGSEPRAVIHLRAGGPWSTRLKSLVQQEGAPLKLQVEGPYETSLSSHPPTVDVVVMIAGGVGVTPLLALLRQYMRYALVRAAGGTAPAPPRVYFLWSSRALCDLQLMGADLIRQATRAIKADDAWLDARLAYTGFEQEAAAGDGKLPGGDLAVPPGSKAPWSRTSSDSSTVSGVSGSDQSPAVADVAIHLEGHEAQKGRKLAQGGTPGPLAGGPWSQPLVYIPCALLCFFGAFGGLCAAWYYDAYYARTTATGANYSSIGCIQFVAISLCGLLPPILLLASLALYRRSTAALKAESAVRDPMHSPVVEDCPDMLLPGSSSAVHGGLDVAVLPAYGGLVPADQESGAAAPLPLLRGRPDVRGLLREVLAAHPEQKEIQVLVGGPEAMYLQVREYCHVISGAGCGAGPVLVCRAVAHQR